MRAARREVPRFTTLGKLHAKPGVEYLCAVCNSWKPAKLISGADHIDPVVSIDIGFTDWNAFVARLFCQKVNLQVICIDCHKSKTNVERVARLLRQYNEELDLYEQAALQHPHLIRAILIELDRYVAKKKLAVFREIADRALEMQRILSPLVI